MIECKKRQKIITNGLITYRCINKNSDIFGQVVDDICSNCQLNNNNAVIHEWNIKCGACKRRTVLSEKNSICSGTGALVTKHECEACKYDLEIYNLDPDKILENYNNLKDEPAKEYPATITQVNNYRLAVTRWIKAGRPKRTDEEIADIYENHCKKCNWYDARSSRCKGCGCRVVPKGLALVNKLKMATEHCPREFF